MIKRRLVIFKTLEIGGLSSNALVAGLKVENHVGESAEKGIMGKNFSQPRIPALINLVIIKPRDFEFSDTWLKTRDLLSQEYLNKWSKENLKDQVLELCPSCVGPFLRGQYRDQPLHEELFIASPPFKVFSSALKKMRDGMFRVGHNRELGKYLRIHWTYNGEGWKPPALLVYQCRNI